MVIVAVFQTIFSLGQPASDLLQLGLDRVAVHLSNVLPPGLINSLVVNGVWKGAGSVLVFIPQILLLFLVIGILEDSGYLARAAVISDKVMAKVGLNGKSFIPLLSAYGCAVPAVMATRTIENKRDRIATILIAPFMTCSARLPEELPAASDRALSAAIMRPVNRRAASPVPACGGSAAEAAAKVSVCCNRSSATPAAAPRREVPSPSASRMAWASAVRSSAASATRSSFLFLK